MKRSLPSFLCLALLLMAANVLQAQTTTINYTSSSLSSSSCNVFNPAANVNSVSHSSHAGSVTFNSTNGLLLTTAPKAAPTRGTAFIINYSFIPNNSYTITVTAKGRPSLLLKTAVVPNLNQFNTASQTACNASDANVPGYNLVGYGNISTGTTTSSADYSVPFTMTGAGSTYQYLVVWASGGDPALDLDVLSISKIVIANTTPTFTIASTTLSCGSTTPKVFTITNVNSTPGVTAYSWNLGSASNGWLHNGSPAPQIINTGTTNTLTLTPVCGSALQSISATVTANGNNYNTNTASATYTMPSMSISGSDELCSGSEQYSISNLPCNASVTWGISDQNIATVSPTGNVTRVGDGRVTLTATVTACGTQVNITPKFVYVGTPAPPVMLTLNGFGYTAQNASQYCIGAEADYEISVVDAIAGASYTWDVYGADFRFGQGSNEAGITVPAEGSSWVDITVYPTNNCGAGSSLIISIPVCGAARMAKVDKLFTISPNPASDIINIQSVAAIDKRSKASFISEVRIYDYTGLLKQQQRYVKGTMSAQLNVSHLKTGVYIVEIVTGGSKERQQVLIRR